MVIIGKKPRTQPVLLQIKKKSDAEALARKKSESTGVPHEAVSKGAYYSVRPVESLPQVDVEVVEDSPVQEVPVVPPAGDEKIVSMEHTGRETLEHIIIDPCGIGSKGFPVERWIKKTKLKSWKLLAGKRVVVTALDTVFTGRKIDVAKHPVMEHIATESVTAEPAPAEPAPAEPAPTEPVTAESTVAA